uniref:ACE1 transcription factor n=1 Tax=Ganoderma lucidum TaxID=5315 RepID=A0A514YQT9_GANLU|nr:ACE1 transcription factor [Ganoderma lucidum]
MVFVGDKKYACETCIKGHRSSSCKHTDRPLFEIKKKGRPITQCEHCRELRKTRQIHVKCVCESKEIAEEGLGATGSKGTKLPARAAFPSGLPEELLEASVASQPFSEGSDSEQSTSERRGSEARPIAPSPNEALSEPAALVAQAHAAGNRPVLPKPPTERPDSPSRASHNPSVSQSSRLPSHGQSFYSPYGRAYDYSHATGYTTFGDGNASSLQHLLNAAPNSTTPFDTWSLSADNAGFPISPASASPPVCGCGTSCACPGCMEHNGPSIDPNGACSNPANCAACLECNINTLAALATANPRAMFDASDMQNVDDWLSSVPDPVPFTQQPPIFSPTQSQTRRQGQNEPDLRYDAAMMQQYGLWNGATAPMQQVQPTEDCCGGQCACPPGMCQCAADHYDSTSGRTLTFAVSGERAPCCGGGPSQTGSARSLSGNAIAGPSSSSRAAPGPNMGASRMPTSDGQAQWFAPTLAVPRTSLSRASSSSSKSSGPLSASSSSPAPFGDVVTHDVAQTQRGTAAEVGSSMGNLSMNAGVPSMPSTSGAMARRRGSDHNEYRTQTQGRRY